jgi:outer membrane receptor protein involved in Fe transport
MSNSRVLTRAAQCAVAVAFAGTIGPVFAQGEQAQAGGEPEEIIVTGTRIISPNMTSTSPIQVVTAQEIQQQGRADIADVMAQLPQNFASTQGQGFSNRTSGLNSAGGVTTADLRGLGPQRTLVLVNGRRLGPGTPNTVVQAPAPDLGQIPMALVERVDVVTGGASAVYGSDAIAGVINFVMKRDFEGLQLDYQMGENWDSNDSAFSHRLNREFGLDPVSGTAKDGRNVRASLLAGTNFADGRGNITAYFTYLQADPVFSGDRDYGQCQITAVPPNFDRFTCTGSGNSNRFTIANAEYAVVGNEFVPWSASARTNPPPLFNSQPYISIARDDERYTAGFMAHMALNDYVEPYVEFNFMNDRTNQVIAPSGLFETGNVLTLDNLYRVNCGNPFLSAQQRAVMGCTGDPNQIGVFREKCG